MKHVKILLQLHSIKLIMFTVLAIVFLAMTATYSSNKTTTPQSDVSIASEDANRMSVANSGPTRIRKGIE